MSQRSIFRTKALQRYLENREKPVLPRLLTPPVFLCCWLLLAIVITAGIAAWFGQVPVYITGSGIILDNCQECRGATALLFLPPNPSFHLSVRMPIHLQIGTSGLQLNSTIATFRPDPLSPNQIRQQYGLGDNAFSLITQPSLIVTAQLDASISGRLYAGSLVTAQLQVGSRRLISLFPGGGAF